MSDNDIPGSGSRWEPAEGAAEPAHQPAIEPAPAAERPPMAWATEPVAPAPASRRPRRSALAAAGVGLVLAGGLVGFAAGHALAGTDGTPSGISTDADQEGIPDGAGGGDRGPRPDVDRDGDGHGGPGTQPDGVHPEDPNSSPGDDAGGIG